MYNQLIIKIAISNWIDRAKFSVITSDHRAFSGVRNMYNGFRFTIKHKT